MPCICQEGYGGVSMILGKTPLLEVHRDQSLYTDKC